MSDHPTDRRRRGDATIRQAVRLLERRLRRPNVALSDPARARQLAYLKLADRPHEVFAIAWLDAQNRLISFDEVAVGSIAHCDVPAREVVKRALAVNAAAAILVHNHPSGVAEPSRSDELLTMTLERALGLIEVRVHDHLVIGDALASTVSFAERGLMGRLTMPLTPPSQAGRRRGATSHVP